MTRSSLELGTNWPSSTRKNNGVEHPKRAIVLALWRTSIRLKQSEPGHQHQQAWGRAIRTRGQSHWRRSGRCHVGESRNLFEDSTRKDLSKRGITARTTWWRLPRTTVFFSLQRRRYDRSIAKHHWSSFAWMMIHSAKWTKTVPIKYMKNQILILQFQKEFNRHQIRFMDVVLGPYPKSGVGGDAFFLWQILGFVLVCCRSLLLTDWILYHGRQWGSILAHPGHWLLSSRCILAHETIRLAWLSTSFTQPFAAQLSCTCTVDLLVE
jgi:hypothetical protein